mmetsp:Transcript_37091/g.111096  ORF Transcript_37091/g.111096 Transcript_37091/m.111096 type:complete len:103 (+) Transcript_37091:1494-1802(+)
MLCPAMSFFCKFRNTHPNLAHTRGDSAAGLAKYIDVRNVKRRYLYAEGERYLAFESSSPRVVEPRSETLAFNGCSGRVTESNSDSVLSILEVKSSAEAATVL